MATNNEYSTLIEKFFDRQMTGSEKAAFEDQLTRDPMLQSEFEHQKEIVQGLKEYRKLQLKTRLDNIPVNPGIVGAISQSTTMKVVSYVAATILVGTGIYFLIPDDKNNSIVLENLQPKLDYVTQHSEIPEFDLTFDFAYAPGTVKEEWVEQKVESKSVITQEEENVVEVSGASFAIPDMTAQSDDSDPLQTEDLLREAPKQLDELSGDITPVKIEIENIISNEYSFHYKLENGKLFLFGKFDVSPYKIIEVNSKTGKKLFFHYNGNYFKLNKQREITPLEEILDQSLIKELEIIKSK